MRNLRARSLRLSVALCLAIVVAVGPASAGTVTLADQSGNPVVVRERAGADNAAVGQLQAGEQAELIDEVPYWYKVRLADGTEGYVSKAKTVASEEPAAPPGPTPAPNAAHGGAADASPAEGATTSGTVAITEVRAVSLLTTVPPAAGGYRVHLIDVGTGLSLLVQGHDFNLVFDGGSRDDRVRVSDNKNRLLSYLFATVGPSGPASCAPAGDQWAAWGGTQRTIDHLVLSHPHEDHNSMLADVLRCYRVEHVWDSGVINDSAVHGKFVKAVASEPDLQYHTAAPIPANRKVKVQDQTITFPAALQWTTFGEGDVQPLDNQAKFTVLYADPEKHGSDYNSSSLVLRVDLGRRSVLLTGDTESGERMDPSSPAGGAERALLDRHRGDIDVDILQVAHHGSKTSNRREFIKAVSPHWALVGSGPFPYSGTVLPDREVVALLDELARVVLNTNLNDDDCPASDRVGADEDSPGGCENFVLDIAP